MKYYKKGEPMGSDAFLKAQFKLLVNVIQVYVRYVYALIIFTRLESWKQ